MYSDASGLCDLIHVIAEMPSCMSPVTGKEQQGHDQNGFLLYIK